LIVVSGLLEFEVLWYLRIHVVGGRKGVPGPDEDAEADRLMEWAVSSITVIFRGASGGSIDNDGQPINLS